MVEPQAVGRYRILSVAGRGAMGVVYRAEDPLIGRTVAIKSVALEALPDGQREEFKARFVREAQTAGRLHHPNVVTIFDVGEHDGVPFMAQEFIDGESLARRLETRGPLPWAVAADLVAQVAAGLDYAHREGVVHRDVKPDNILVDRSGRAVITDFGIARPEASDLTRTGEILGTPHFMSPEQVLAQPVDGRSDLFSLGVVLYALLTGRRPFTGGSVTSVCYQIVHGEPRPFPQDLDAPPALTDLVLRLLAKDPAARPRSGAELAALLGRVAEGSGTAPRADSSLDGATSPSLVLARKRGRVPAVLAALVALGALAVTGWALVDGRRPAGPVPGTEPAVSVPAEAPAPAPAGDPAEDGLSPADRTPEAEAAPAAPAAATAAPAEPEPAAAAQELVTLRFVAEAPFARATLRLYVDGHEALVRQLDAGRARFRRPHAQGAGELQIDPGPHALRFVLDAPRGFHAEAEQAVDIPPGGEVAFRVHPTLAPPALVVSRFGN